MQIPVALKALTAAALLGAGLAVAPAPAAADEPATPAVTEAPPAPVTEEPAEPVTDEPAEPVTDEPAQPVEETPVEQAPGGGVPVVEAPAARKPLRILPLGDSLTWGKGSTDVAGYRKRLYLSLTAAGVAVDFVGSQSNGSGFDTDHEGHPGWRIDQIDAQTARWIRATGPDVVLLDAGTNDYVQKRDVARAPARLATMVDRIIKLAPHAKIVLARLLVIQGDRRAAGVRALNAAIPGIAAARRGHVVVADMSRISAANTVDGVHPTDAGYRQMAYQWFQALRRVVPGGSAWRSMADPFPVPAVRVTAARSGAKVTVTARLTGMLTAVDLSNVTVRLRIRRAGTDTWTGLGTARTDRNGVVHLSRRLPATGYVTATVVAGRAAGRSSGPVRV